MFTGSFSRCPDVLHFFGSWVLFVFFIANWSVDSFNLSRSPLHGLPLSCFKQASLLSPDSFFSFEAFTHLLSWALQQLDAPYHGPCISVNIPAEYELVQFHDLFTQCNRGSYRLVAASNIVRVFRRQGFFLIVHSRYTLPTESSAFGCGGLCPYGQGCAENLNGSVDGANSQPYLSRVTLDATAVRVSTKEALLSFDKEVTPAFLISNFTFSLEFNFASRIPPR